MALFAEPFSGSQRLNDCFYEPNERNPVKTSLLLVLLPPLVLALSCAAGETNAPAAEVSSPIVITATRTLRESLKVPAGVSVVDSQALGASAARNPDDALRAVPGVTVMRQFGMADGMPSQVNVRGVPGTHRILMLADGIPLNDTSTRFLSLNEIPLDAIRQIEVIRGPFSCLYGTDAFGGVINMLTRSGADKPGLELRGAAGNGGYYGAGAGYGGAQGNWDYRLEIDRRNTGNYLGRDLTIERRYDYATSSYADSVVPVENRDYADSRILGKASVDLGDKSSLSLSARYYQGELGYGQKSLGALYPTPVDNVTRMRTAMGGGMLSSEFSPAVDVRLGGYVRRQSRELWGLDLSHFDGQRPVYVPSYMENLSSEWQAEAGADIKLGSSHVLSAGADVKRSACNFSPLSNAADKTPLSSAVGAEDHAWNTGIYLQDEIKCGRNAVIVAGARADNNSQFGWAVSPRAGALYTVSEDTTVRGSVGRAFRAPTLVEMFQPPMSFGYVTFVSNPNLKPEYITAADGEIEHRFSGRVSGKVGVFFNDMKDIIEDKASGDTLTNENISKARTYGAEAGLSWRISENLAASAAYTRIEAENLETGGKLDYIPADSFSIGLNSQGLSGNWRIEGSLAGLFTGTRGFTDWASGSWYSLPSCWRLDAALKGTFKDNYWIAARLQNATDEKYQESMMSPLAPGRLASIEAGIRF